MLTVEEKGLYDYGRKAGIKEVVDFINREINMTEYSFAQWQAKLKEWGISQQK